MRRQAAASLLQRDPQRRRAILALVGVNALWGLSFPIVKALNLQMETHFGVEEATADVWLLARISSWVIAVRFLIAFALILLLCRRLVATVRLPHVLAGAAIGGMFFAGLLLQVAGLASIPASRSGFLTSLVVVWTPIFSTLGQRRLPRRQTLLGAAVSILGVSILTGMIRLDAGHIGFADDALSRWRLGDTLTSIAVLFFTGQIILVDSLAKRYESTAFTPSMFATTALCASAMFAGLQLFQLDEASVEVRQTSRWLELVGEVRFIVPVLVLSVFSTLVAFFWMNRYQPFLTAGQAAVLYTLEPLFASSWAMFLPAWLSIFCHVSYANEQLSWQLVGGGALLILANGLALWPQRKTTDSERAPAQTADPISTMQRND